jgi:hypothetical protein
MATVDVTMPHTGRAQLEVFDLLGRQIAMFTYARLDKGGQHLQFDATVLPHGTYICRLQVNELFSNAYLLVVH